MPGDNKVLAERKSKSTRAVLAQGLLRLECPVSVLDGQLDFGSALFGFRNAAGLTQEKVATRSGLTRGYYSQLENSKRPPPPPLTLKRIANALKLSEQQITGLKHFAEMERCLVLGIPNELPADMVCLLKLIVSRAYRLSPQRLHEISKLVTEETVM